MLWLVITMVLVLAAIASFIWYNDNVAIFCVFFAFIGFIFGMWSPLGGYEEEALQEEYKLIPIFEESNIYIIETENGTKIYKLAEKNQYDDNIDQIVIKQKGGSTKIEYVKEYTEPVLRKYVQKPSRSLFNGIY